MNTISQETLQSKFRSEKKDTFILIDLRPEIYFQEFHLENAKNFCVHELAFLSKIQEAFPNTSTPLLIYGPNAEGFEAKKAYELITQNGYSNVQVLEGGICDWLGQKAHETNYQDESIAPYISKTFTLDLTSSRIQWFGRNAANNHTGQLRFSKGSFTTENSQLKNASLCIDMKSLICDDLKDSKLNTLLVNHLKSADFFSIDDFPTAEITLKTCRIFQPTYFAEDNAEISFTLNLRGKSLPLTTKGVLYIKENALNFQGHLRFDRTLFDSIYGSKKFFKSLATHVVNDLIEINFTLNAN